MRRSEVPALHQLCSTTHTAINIDQKSEEVCRTELEAGHRDGAAHPQDAVPALQSLDIRN